MTVYFCHVAAIFYCFYKKKSVENCSEYFIQKFGESSVLHSFFQLNKPLDTMTPTVVITQCDGACVNEI